MSWDNQDENRWSQIYMAFMVRAIGVLQWFKTKIYNNVSWNDVWNLISILIEICNESHKVGTISNRKLERFGEFYISDVLTARQEVEDRGILN